MKKLLYFLAGVVALGIAVVIVTGLIQPQAQIASVTQGNEYNSTTTKTTLFSQYNTLKAGQGALGSVIITKVGTDNWWLLDATTTNANLRASSQTTSTIPVLAFFPASTAVGTYIFDTVFTKGLLFMSWGAATTMGSTTITWR